MRPIRVALTATNEEDDSVFCLVLCEERLHEMMAAPHPAMSAERIWDHQAYSIVKLDCLYDDTSRLVTGITEMRQLGLADITAISGLPDPMLTSSNGMEVEKQVEGRAKDRSNYRSMVTAAAQLPGTWLFPHLHVRKAPRAAAGLLGAAPDIDVVQAKRSIHHWAMAASSDHNEEQELEQCLSPHSFQLMDGHGVISTSISMWRESVLAQIAASKKAYRKIEVNLIDSAICTAYNAGFSHTRTCLYPFPDDIDDRGSDQVISYESMAVYLFDGHGLIEDVWMLSDPLPDQREQMRKAVEPLSYKRTSVEWIP